MKLYSIVFCLFIVLVVGCKKADTKDELEVREFVKQWNETHTQLKSSYLGRDYMDVITYYGKERTRLQVQEDKNLLFEQFPDYTQRILDDELVVTKKTGSYLLTFTKRVNYNGIEADYTCYISVILKNGKFRILREGVAENSKNLDAPIFPYTREHNSVITKNRRLYGDFNGDGLSDYATVISPKISTTTTKDLQDSEEVQCKGACNSLIKFSNSDLKSITINGAYQSQLENLKDLNRDGADEIGFWDIKPTTKSLYIFNATNGALMTKPVVINTTVHKNLDFIDVFKKAGPNKITVTHSALENGKWVLKSEVVTLD
ncbi:hypothetical protein [Psychroserpens sp.]|jgi:hypothetical protein|uniref:hypothetical protein n=1 Tax=Psychroserpens sp. TaxID=2020870 RepID=UPI0039E3EF0E